METILVHAQAIVYSLVRLMPTAYQRDNLQAILGLFLQAEGCPLPEYSPRQVPECPKPFFE